MNCDVETKIMIHLGAAFLLAVGIAAAQSSSETQPAFEVASVKAVASGPIRSPNGGWIYLGPRLDWSGGRLTLRNYSLKSLICDAYDVKDYQVVGPKWLDSEKYEIVAKAPAGTSEQQARRMVQGLLADRFQLVLHRETKDLPAYALVVGKGGHKLRAGKPSRDTGDDGLVRFKLQPGRISTKQGSMEWLANQLTGRLGRPVVDATGIKGEFPIELNWTPEEGEQGPIGLPTKPHPAGAGPSTPDVAGNRFPSIFTAVQEQLGLKLEGRKLPTEILVIDRVERPSAN